MLHESWARITAWPKPHQWIIVVTALFGAGLAAAFSVVSVMQLSNPAVALAFDRGNARANARLAQTMLEQSGSPAQVAQIATRALVRDPTAVEAARALGIAQAQLHDEDGADRSMNYAASLSQRDLGTTLWLIERAVQRNDVGGALHLYDVALRTSRGAYKVLFPIMAATLSDREFALPIARVLRNSPIWRRNFLEFVMNGKTTAADVSRLFVAMKASGTKVDDDLSKELIDRLVTSGDFDRAWNLYVSLWPSERMTRNIVRNQRLRYSHQTAFDWQFTDSAEATFLPASSHLANLRSFSAAPLPIAYQLLMLQPGHYELAQRGVLKSGDREALVWTLNCAGSDREIARTFFNSNVRANFAVVPEDCPAQWLRLIVTSLGQNVIEANIDTVSIRRSETTSAQTYSAGQQVE